jgi:hypothetical protein
MHHQFKELADVDITGRPPGPSAVAISCSLASIR